MQYILGQIVGIIVTILCLVGPFWKKRWMMLCNSVAANFLAALNLILIGSFGSAILLNTVGMIQATLSLWHVVKNVKVTLAERIIFMLLFLGCGIYGMVSAPGFVPGFTWGNLLETLPIFAALIFCITTFIRSEQTARWVGLWNCVLWLVYYGVIGSTVVFAQVAGIIATFGGIYKYRDKGRKGEVKMKAKIIEEARVICSNRTSIHNYFGWPSINRLPDGTLAMVASGMRVRHICPFGKVIACYSRDNGKTWTKPMILIDTALDDRDAGIAVSKNRVMVTSFNNTIEQQRIWNAETRNIQYYPSESRPTLYSKPEVHSCTRGYIEEYLNSVDEESAVNDFLGSVYMISEDGGCTYGEMKKSPVSAPHGPAVGIDGKFVYVGRAFNSTIDEKNTIKCYIEGDDGEFHYTGCVEDVEAEGGEELVFCEPHSIVLPDGKIIVHIRVQTEYKDSDYTEIFTLYQSESTDGGKTFTKPHRIIGMQSGAPAHLLRLENGTLISVYGYREEPYGIKAIISKDDGETWSEEYMLYNNNGIALDIGYPASVEIDDGKILTIFYARPEAGAPAEIMQVIWEVEE